MIPIFPDISWFKSLNSAISKFYWKNKTSRIKLSTLQKSKAQGGLEAPNYVLYHLANQLKYLTKWHNPHKLDSFWLETQQAFSNDIQLSDLPFISQTIKHHYCFQSMTISSTLTAWWKALQITNSTVVPSPRTPIWNNPDLCINKKNITFLCLEGQRNHTSLPYHWRWYLYYLPTSNPEIRHWGFTVSKVPTIEINHFIKT